MYNAQSVNHYLSVHKNSKKYKNSFMKLRWSLSCQYLNFVFYWQYNKENCSHLGLIFKVSEFVLFSFDYVMVM